MKNLLILFFFLSFSLHAQYSVKGTLNPVKKYSWVLLYKVEGAKQVFIKNTQIETEGNTGVFKFNLPKDTKIGSYRITYDLKSDGFIDFLFNKENVEIELDPSNPNTTTVNTTATAAKFIATANGQSYALTFTDDMGAFTFSANNSLVKMMVLKSVSSVVALKFEDSTNPAFSTIVEVTNSITNGDWEELIFNFGTSVGNTYDRMVVIPDFIERAENKTIYFDQISFNVNNTLEDYYLEDIDFESTGFGANWVWTTDNNYTDPPLEMVANPNTGGANNSSTVAKFTSTTAGDPWALTYTDNIGSFTFTEANSMVTIMVRKSKVSDVGLKFEGPGGIYKEIKISNTLTNGDWEQMSFDFSSEIGNTFNRFVVIPDFDDSRFQDHVSYFDQISFGNQTAGFDDYAINFVKMYPNPANSIVNFSSPSNEVLEVAIYDLSLIHI